MATGVILAGGRSRRFGDSDKALAELDGVPMLRRVGDGLASVVDELVVSCRDDQHEAFGSVLAGAAVPVRFATDPVPDRGPVAGLLTGCHAVDTQYALVTACDMPFVDPRFLKLLVERAASADAALAVFSDRRQPFPGCYRVAATIEACAGALDGSGRVDALLDTLDPIEIEESLVRERTDERSFLNINTREEFVAARGGEHPRGGEF